MARKNTASMAEDIINGLNDIDETKETETETDKTDEAKKDIKSARVTFIATEDIMKALNALALWDNKNGRKIGEGKGAKKMTVSGLLNEAAKDYLQKRAADLQAAKDLFD